jgi:hypothetical protein
MDENNPKSILPDVSSLKLEALSKIREMKHEIIKAF